jgi:UDP-N-acetylmuramyl pentapeptide phosphotransferase/UDP-N-acetylglucosamine-1-phosphate transferase
MENMYYCSLLFVLIFKTTFFSIPKIRRISLKFNLTDTASHRSSHLQATPSFGGVAFYISYIITLFVIQFFDENQVSLTRFGFTGKRHDAIGCDVDAKRSVFEKRWV